MSLNLAQFKTDLGTALKEAAALNDKDNVAKDTALQNIADKIDAYIKTATVSVTVAQGIAVSVTPSSGHGATIATGSGTGSLS